VETIIAMISLLTMLAFFIGLIKPAWVKMTSRIRSSVVYGIIFICVSTLGATFYPTEKISGVAATDRPVDEKPLEPATDKLVPADEKPLEPARFDKSDMLLGDYRQEAKDKRREIVSDYVKSKGVPESATDSFYACLSEHSFTKADDLALGDVLGWCDADYSQDPKSLAKRINFDVFQGNFSGWSGSYRPLEKLIKLGMNDDKSYKHVSTTYRLSLGRDPHAVVKTTFRGTNAYGGVVKQTVAARVDIRTGDIIQIVEN